MRNPIAASLSFDRAIKDLAAWVVRRLVARDALLASRAVLRVARIGLKDQPVQAEEAAAEKKAKPRGPFSDNGACDLFIFVPRSLESFLIDEGTGHYGYSHIAVDCGEVEAATGKRVMIESSPGLGVHRNYQDHYGQRPFIRIPFAFAQTDPEEFRKCIQSRVGEKYDKLEVLTWGKVDDPAKQICSDLAAACLSPRTLADFERKQRASRLGRRTMSSHRRFGRRSHIFISRMGLPNIWVRRMAREFITPTSRSSRRWGGGPQGIRPVAGGDRGERGGAGGADWVEAEAGAARSETG
jgi:hypothetical protein